MSKLSKHFKPDFNGQADKKAIIQGDKYRFTILTSKLIRIEYSQDGIFEDKPTQSVVNRNFEVPEYRIVETTENLEIITENLHLYYKKGEFTANNLYIDVSGQYTLYGSRWHYGMEINDLKGTTRTLDQVDGEIELDSGVISAEGFSVTDDSKSHIINEDGWVEPRKKDIVDIYFWGYGRSYFECMKDFYKLTGPTPILPRYTLGNWWSRYYAYNDVEYKELMTKFKKENIPFTVSVIDMDWHITEIDPKYGAGWTGYTWNKELFPDPKEFLTWLHDENLKITLNLHPASGVRAYEEMYESMAKELGIDYENESPIPFEITNKEFMQAYFKYLHNPLEEDGVDFWWIDWQQGNTTGIEGLDPLWMLNHYHFYDKMRQDERAVIFSRYAGIGSHRYPIGFSGDTIITWESLQFQPYFTSTATNVGYCWWSHDIGGHMLGYKDDELSTRWLQYGVFSPIMRLHSTCSSFNGKEPWNYGIQHEIVMKKYLNLRHKFIPYNYTMNYKMHKELIPFITPMYYHYPMEERAYEMKNQYFFGSEIMVSPIVTPIIKAVQMASVKTYIPQGIWFDFFNGTRYDGECTMKLFRSLKDQVVLAKAGGIIPLSNFENGDNSSDNPKDLEIIVFAGQSNIFELVEDNGRKNIQTDEDVAITKIELVWDTKAILTINKPVGDISAIPNNRNIKVMLRGVTKNALDNININIENKNQPDTIKTYDIETKTVEITINNWDISKDIEIILSDVNCINDNFDYKQKIHAILYNAFIDYEPKDKILSLMNKSDNKIKLLNDIKNFNLDQDLFDAILEVMS